METPDSEFLLAATHPLFLTFKYQMHIIIIKLCFHLQSYKEKGGIISAKDLHLSLTCVCTFMLTEDFIK